MHYKNILKKTVVLALSLVCTHGVAMEQEQIAPRPPRTRTVDFRFEYYDRITGYPVVATTVQGIRITTRPQITSYLIKKGVEEAARQGFMFHYRDVKSLSVN